MTELRVNSDASFAFSKNPNNLSKDDFNLRVDEGLYYLDSKSVFVQTATASTSNASYSPETFVSSAGKLAVSFFDPKSNNTVPTEFVLTLDLTRPETTRPSTQPSTDTQTTSQPQPTTQTQTTTQTQPTTQTTETLQFPYRV